MTERPPRDPRRPVAWNRGNRERLSQDSIVEAALRIVDAEGVDAVTMRRVAQELQTGAASLYAHVADKDELLALVFDLVVGGVDLSVPDGPWTEQTKTHLRRWRTALLEHRDLAKVNLGTVPTGPSAVRGMEAVLAVLHGAGLPNRVVGYAADLLGQFVTAATYEAALWRQRVSTPEADEAFRVQLQEFFDSLPPEQFPTFRLLAGDLTGEGESEDDRFEFGLDILMRGLASHLP